MVFLIGWLTFLYWIPEIGKCEQVLSVYWGKPTNFSASGSYKIQANSWVDCYENCLKSAYCVLAAGNDNECVLHDYQTVFEVAQLDESSGLKVAMRINETTCPAVISEKTSYFTVSDPTYPYTTFDYSYTYSMVGLWTFAYNVTRSCPPDWTMYSRPLSDYCLKLFGTPTTTYKQSQATDYCDDQNATLAGLETIKERDDMTALGRAINMQDARGLVFSGFWVSGVRKASCSTLAQVATAACNSTKAFELSDKYITNLSGYIWAPSNPDGVSASGPYQDCIMLRTQTNGTTLLGMIDDVQCTYSTGSQFDIHGYVCGKVPGI
ncbi:unnamed protein product [Caenorhabditis brenneri]